jgi:hypothetical protein
MKAVTASALVVLVALCNSCISPANDPLGPPVAIPPGDANDAAIDSSAGDGGTSSDTPAMGAIAMDGPATEAAAASSAPPTCAAGNDGAFKCDGTCATAREASCCGADRSIDLDQDDVPDCEQSLLPSGQFNKTLDPWSADGTNRGAVAWSPMDSRGRADSGSMRVTVSDPEAVTAVYGPTTPCVTGALTATSTLVLFYFIPPGQGAGGVTWGARFYADDHCRVLIENRASEVGSNNNVNTWFFMRALLNPPSGTRSMVVSVFAERDTTAGTFVAYFDNIVLRR